jgi:hypothetical protein
LASDTEGRDDRYEPADYRVRIFLSVDLSGSTAYKNSKTGEERSDGPTPKWVTVFQQFYTDFPAQFRTNFAQQKSHIAGPDRCPVLWKAVGDELVFCGRVSNKRTVTTALIAFIETLHDYRKLLQDSEIELNLKGAGWLAAFPEPNRAVQLSFSNEAPDTFSASEALESSADARPFEYDFLGKAIDTGFRVASTAKPERFVLSVQLARLLVGLPAGSGFDHSIRFDQPFFLKGVNKGEPYPMLYIDTMTHLRVEGIRTKARSLLGQNGPPDRGELLDYLDAYCYVAETDDIMLPATSGDEQPEGPSSYLGHRKKIAEHLQQEKTRAGDYGGDSIPDGEIDELPNVEELNPLSG